MLLGLCFIIWDFLVFLAFSSHLRRLGKRPCIFPGQSPLRGMKLLISRVIGLLVWFQHTGLPWCAILRDFWEQMTQLSFGSICSGGSVVVLGLIYFSLIFLHSYFHALRGENKNWLIDQVHFLSLRNLNRFETSKASMRQLSLSHPPELFSNTLFLLIALLSHQDSFPVFPPCSIYP